MTTPQQERAAMPPSASKTETPVPSALVVTAAPGAMAASAALSDSLAILQEEGLGGDGLVSLNDADRQLGSQMPRVALVQKPEQVDGDEGRPGAYIHLVTGEQMDAPAVSLLAQKFSRQYLSAYTGEGIAVVCASTDGRERDWPDDRSSDPGAAPPMGQQCATCPHARWSGKTAPKCSELFSLLLFLHESLEPVVYFVRRTGIKPWRAAFQRVRLAGLRAARPAGLPGHLAVQCTMGSDKVVKSGKSWYEPRFFDFKAIANHETLARLVECAAAVAPQFARSTAEELGADLDPVVGPDGVPGSSGGGIDAPDDDDFDSARF